ncbi:DMT family transporter [Maritimibacter dapengensis]|uniref:QacE family quaternary ammonium compound efflux SMR transporter n=1 Tax=Maritimibacter dapengensis TaxID=2836868 RepID=A0ABS6T0U8_9RHOB|nr:QacE family quaternary ammonium compound efflux SMR transporter [Maritimibacter dapengensis]
MRYLVIAVCIELVALAFLKKGWGFPYSLIPIGFLVLSYFVFEKALVVVPLSAAYALWAGIGIVGSIAIGRVFFGEALSLAGYAFIALITIGIVGLAFSR